mgnify:CR=1 FL=1
MNFRSQEFLLEHVKTSLNFYQEHGVDPNGGFYQTLNQKGEVFDTGLKQLVSSARMTFNYTLAKRFFKDDQYDVLIQHGIDFVEKAHFDKENEAYHWILDGEKVLDTDNYAYGFAFIILMYSGAYEAGFESAKAGIEKTFATMEKHLWQEEFGLYADQSSGDWSRVNSYRGQNANMHACEAMIAAFEATNDEKYLDRAVLIAENICLRNTKYTDGYIWEHYDSDWQVDWDYNKDDPRNLYKPWGYQPGHFIEWTKLLLLIRRHRNLDWLLPQAKMLFDVSVEKAWDKEEGGFFYGFGPDDSICDDEKYFWVHAEAFAGAALLADALDDESYWQIYDQIWEYSWGKFCESSHGPWLRLLDRSGKNINEMIASPGAKIEYHPIAAACEVLRTINL